MSKYTPGPWRVLPEDKTSRNNLCVESVNGAGYICDVQAEWQDAHEATPEQWANARLIAAAPDLLAALREYVRMEDARRAGGEINFADRCRCYWPATFAIGQAEKQESP